MPLVGEYINNKKNASRIFYPIEQATRKPTENKSLLPHERPGTPRHGGCDLLKGMLRCSFSLHNVPISTHIPFPSAVDNRASSSTRRHFSARDTPGNALSSALRLRFKPPTASPNESSVYVSHCNLQRHEGIPRVNKTDDNHAHE